MIDVRRYKEYIYDVIGCIYEVHKKLGPGLNEYVYQEGLELTSNNIPFKREVKFHPLYDGKEMKAEYRLDFECKSDIIIELKSVSELCNDNRAQLFNYMRLRNARCGIVVNYSPDFAVVERYFYDSDSRTLYNVNGEQLKTFQKNRYR